MMLVFPIKDLTVRKTVFRGNADQQLKQGSNGFTLVEILVALTIMTVMFSLLFSGFRLGNRAWDKASEKTARLTDYQVTYKIFGDWLTHLYPAVSRSSGEMKYVFQGSDHHVRFTSYMPAYPTRGGLYEVMFAIEQGENADRSSRLVLYRRFYDPVRDDDINFSPEERVVLLDGIAGDASFDFFGAETRDQDSAWSSNWPESATENLSGMDWYPSLVRLKLSGVNMGKRGWPDVVVPIRVTLDSRCIGPRSSEKSLCRNESGEIK